MNGQASNSFDTLIAIKQKQCDHVEQNKITVNKQIFCGDCAKEVTN